MRYMALKSAEPVEAVEVAGVIGKNPDSAVERASLYGYNEGLKFFGESVLRALALPYAEHADYDERWKP